jgi:hypothetical protein
VLEMANNHWGDLKRGLKIIKGLFAHCAFQQRQGGDQAPVFVMSTPLFIRIFRERSDIRYIKKNPGYTAIQARICHVGAGDPQGRLHPDGDSLRRIVGEYVRAAGGRDHQAGELGYQRLGAHRPHCRDQEAGNRLDGRIVAQGYRRLGGVFFSKRNIPLAINHCVSIYPSEDRELELNQVDFSAAALSESRHRLFDARIQRLEHVHHHRLRQRGRAPSSGISTSRVTRMRYRRTAACRTRSISGSRLSKKAVEMCGAPGDAKSAFHRTRKTSYLDALVSRRFMRAAPSRKARSSPAMRSIWRCPCKRDRFSCREWMNGEVVQCDISPNAPVMIEMIDSPLRR